MSEPRYPAYTPSTAGQSTDTDEQGAEEAAQTPAVDFPSTDWSTPAHTDSGLSNGHQLDAYPPVYEQPQRDEPDQHGSLPSGPAFGEQSVADRPFTEQGFAGEPQPDQPFGSPYPGPPFGSGGPFGDGRSPADGQSFAGAVTITGPSPGQVDVPPYAASGAAPPMMPQTGQPLVQPVSPPPPSGRTARARGPRRARLQLRHVDPWTVLKFSCVLSVALFFVWLITIGVLYGVLQAAGVVGKINDTVTTINGTGSQDPITPGIVFGGAAIVGVVNIILFIALSTVGSVVYNLCADLVGGVEVTLSERDA